MLKNIKIKKILTSLMLLTLLVTTSNVSYASETNASGVVTDKKVDYSKTIEIAKKKIQVLFDKYGVTSAQVAIIDSGEFILSKAYDKYKKSESEEVARRNMYCIASISKIFTTVAVMKLVDEGKIDLDNPVINYINDFTMADERYKEITPRMLLNHSSGIMGSSFRNVNLLGDADTYAHDNFLKNLSVQRLKANPGSFSVYSNDGFTLAEILVEYVSGMDFTTYIKENITSLLELQNTKTLLDGIEEIQFAKVFTPSSKNELPYDAFNAIGAAGIYTNAEDLCRFTQIFMGDSNPVLTKESALSTQNNEFLNGFWMEGIEDENTISYGLGWDSVNTYPFTRYNIKALTKGGDSSFSHSNITVLPEHNMSIAIITVGGSSSYNQVVAQEILTKALEDKGVIEKVLSNKTFKAPTKNNTPVGLKKYTGIYGSNSDTYEVKFNKAGDLCLYDDSYNDPIIYKYTVDGKFVSPDGGEYIKFIHASNGKDYIYSSSYFQYSGLGQTIISQLLAQKLTNNKLTKEVENIWKTRNGNIYLCISEKYTSQNYLDYIPILFLELNKGISGYVNNAKIIDENNAVNILEIPAINGRDVHDYNFYKIDNVEYLTIGTDTYIDERKLKSMTSKDGSIYTIKSDGMTLWYKIGNNLNGKKIKVTIPNNSGIIQYNSYGKMVYNSYISGEKTLTLEKGGYIAFAGSPKDKFVVKFK